MERIIFVDVDGTLVDYDNVLPSSAITAIRAARDAGHQVFLSTGRSRAEIYPEIWDIGIDGMIGGNGSYIEHDDHVVFHQTLSGEQCRAVVDWLNERGCEFYLEANSGLYESPSFETVGEPVIRSYAAGKGEVGASILRVRDVFPDMIFGADLVRDDVNKISFILNSFDDHLESAKTFSDLAAGTWGGRGASALFGDLGLPAIDKARSVDILLDHLGADRSVTVAFGDAPIDLPMFEACSYAVAMGNASDEVKAVADMVTADVADDGLAKAFEQLGLTM
ncbi:Cof-type HAD-IIB family hydrolase [Actinomyces mediterranea]|uniref:Cof-type HAD-IIB family hydrolase n=1 Tax=Actinomyces mediterranea TaxID=1871028 RepID=UPI00097095E2|nr:Cof-type HAD-IIB family hydrolase [Actinomyces mediterranea]